nr:hypothetical protein [uncultured Emticicia sp.]
MQSDSNVLDFSLCIEIFDSAKEYCTENIFFHGFLDNSFPATTKIGCV